MPTYNFNVKVTTGKNTDIEVVCCRTAYSDKQIEFKGSKLKVNNKRLADYIERLIKQGLKEQVTHHNSQTV